MKTRSTLRTRLAAAVATAGVVLAATGLILVALTYNGAIANPADDSDSSRVGFDQPARTDPEPTLLPPSDDEIAVFVAHGALIDECMADAGFPEYVDNRAGVPTFDPNFQWDADLSQSQKQTAALAMWGDTGAGADYRWDEAGCAGYATHMLGLDNAN